MADRLKITSDMGSYTCLINPESIKYTRKITIETKSGGESAHPAGQLTSHKTYSPETLSFDLIIDGTMLWEYSTMDVPGDLKSLLTCVYEINGGTHECPICTINYADIPSGKEWRCQSVDVNYTLFTTGGDPLRVKVSLSFIEFSTAAKLDAFSKLNSPDMTHLRTIRDGDNLFSICKEIYGKVDYYMFVADHNGLSNFRDLEIGETLEFPPLER